jgi:hypothetical protein
MRGRFQILLILFVTVQIVQADQAARIDLPASYTLEILQPEIIQYDSWVTVSGAVRQSTPWAATAWGYLEISLFDKHGALIKRVVTNYFPRPIPYFPHGSYQPRSHFFATISGVSRTVHSVQIDFRDGSISDLKSGYQRVAR